MLCSQALACFGCMQKAQLARTYAQLDGLFVDLWVRPQLHLRAHGYSL